MKPCICLLGYRGVEEPAAVLVHQLLVHCWVTMLLTVFMRDLVLVEKMPNIDTYTNISKPWILLCLLPSVAVSVIENVLWFPGTRYQKGILAHHLNGF